MDNVPYNRIKEVLVNEERTNKWLASKVGATEITVSRWVSNKSQPSISMLFKIAEALRTDPRQLLNSSVIVESYNDNSN